jgi:copper chaperone CopZ
MSCDHCTASIEDAVSLLEGVTRVVADLSTKIVTVAGGQDAQIRAAIDDAGYDSALLDT